MYFTLTAKDNHDAKLMGADTVRLCEMQGIAPRLKDEKGMASRVENNIRGFKAEFLFARLFNLPPPVVNVLSDGQIDFWLGEYSIDVKCSSKEDGPLIFDSPEKFTADIAVAYGQSGHDPRTFKLHGCIPRKTFFERAYRHDFGHGERYVVDSNNLDPIEKLWRLHIETSHSSGRGRKQQRMNNEE